MKSHYLYMFSFLFLSSLANPAFSQKILLKTEHYPPYNIDLSLENRGNGISGASFEIVSELMNRSGLDYEIELVPWKRAVESAQSNNFTGVFSTTRTESRENLFKWVGPIADNNYILMAYNKKINIKNINDLKKYRIGSYRNSAGDNILKSLNLNTELVRSDYLNINKLKRGRIDLWVTGNLYGPYLAKQYKATDFKPVFTLKEAKMYIAFNLNTPDTVINTLNTTLFNMRKEGFLSLVFNRYTK